MAELHVADATGLSVGSGDHPLTFAAGGRGTWALADPRRLAPTLPAHGRRPRRPTCDSRLAAPGTRDLDDLGDLGSGTWAAAWPSKSCSASSPPPWARSCWACSSARPPATWPSGPSASTRCPSRGPTRPSCWSSPRTSPRSPTTGACRSTRPELWVCVHELTAHAVLSRPHVAGRIDAMLARGRGHRRRGRPAGPRRAARAATPATPSRSSSLMSDPESLLADLLTPGQHRTSARLTAVTTAVGGYVDHVTAASPPSSPDRPGRSPRPGTATGSRTPRASRPPAALFGLDLGREQVDRGAAFVRGVVERAGEDGLARLWTSAKTLPTPAEVDAPGCGWSGSTCRRRRRRPTIPGAAPTGGLRPARRPARPSPRGSRGPSRA